jgi:hypothetical protein
MMSRAMSLMTPFDVREKPGKDESENHAVQHVLDQ